MDYKKLYDEWLTNPYFDDETLNAVLKYEDQYNKGKLSLCYL